MTKITEIEHTLAISRSLSNEKRLKLIILLKDGRSKTLREIYNLSREYIELEHRETLYKYLESLAGVGILKRIETADGGIEYALAKNSITFDFLEMRLD